MTDSTIFPTAPVPGVGPQLAALRQGRGLALQDVSQRLRFSLKQLTLLESGEYDSLPDLTFVRGMIRAYARYLEVDPTPLIEALESERPDAVPRLMTVPSVSVPSQGVGFFRDAPASGRRWVLAGLAVLALAVIVAWVWHSESVPPEPVATQEGESNAERAPLQVPVRPPEP